MSEEFLFVEDVARMLGCNVDFVRRIPRHELPASKVAKRVLYAKLDLYKYILSYRDDGNPRYRAAPFDPVAYVRKQLKDLK